MTPNPSLPIAGEDSSFEAAPEAHSRSFLLCSKTLSGVMAALKASGGAARRKEVQIWAEANLSFTEWEQEEIGASAGHRWWKFMNYVTTEAVKAGLLVKDRGLWTLTEEGEQLCSELGAHEL